MRVIAMRLTCPQCSTEYDVPDTALTAGSRRMRCDRCGHEWRQAAAGAVPDPAAPAPAEPEPAEPAPTKPQAAAPERVTPENLPKFLSRRDPRGHLSEDGAAEPQPMGGYRAIRVEPHRRPPAPEPGGNRKLVWLLVLIVVVIAVALVAHSDVERALPASAGFFHALGLN